MAVPFLKPAPPRLSELISELQEIERSGVFSNYGPTNTGFEQELTRRMFGGEGACLTVNNATTGLMLAIKQAAQRRPGATYALMPSFTFAATAHAALWAGLTPLLCDIDPATWVPSTSAEDALLDEYGERIAAIVPYATFGNGIDLARYDALASKHGVGVVVDAAASLGSLDAAGRGFGTGSRSPVVYSMHVTKTFATAEAGVIHSADVELIAELRTMGNYGFGQPRCATTAGLNAKLSEVGALLALKKLEGFERVVTHRVDIARAYRDELQGWMFQEMQGERHAHQFMPVLLPADRAPSRQRILAELTRSGIGCGSYFSPHLAEQPYFERVCTAGPLAVTQAVAGRIISLPMSDTITRDDVGTVCAALRAAMRAGE